MITLEFLNVITGDKHLYFEDAEPEKRAELAEQIFKLRQQGYMPCLIKGQEAYRIESYDPEANEWIIRASSLPAFKLVEHEKVESADANFARVESPLPEVLRRRGRPRGGRNRVSARDTTASVIAPTAGG